MKPFHTRGAALAARQHGVVTRAQLLDAGFTPDMVDGRVAAGRLRPLHRGVYLLGALVGRLEPPWAREMAAVLACGPGAVASHESAARLWELFRDVRDRTCCVHVTISGANRGRRPGIRVHRVASLPEGDTALLEGIPVTAPARTLVDLAASLTPRALEQALAEAERRQLTDLEDVMAVLERGSRVRGAPLLRRLIRSRGVGLAFTRSAAEERLLALVRKGGLPAPETNARIRGHEVDFFWRSERVVVEVDGFEFHSSRQSFESDRRRDIRLAATGLRTVRVTWRQLTEEPDAVLVRLAQILAFARVEG